MTITRLSSVLAAGALVFVGTLFFFDSQTRSLGSHTRAMDSLRLEKSYKLVGRELSIEYAAFESELQRFVDLKKGDFLGRDALLAWRDRGFANRLVTLEVHDVGDADAIRFFES